MKILGDGIKMNDIDYRCKVGTIAWHKRHNEETKRLSAWRRLHALLPHAEVKKVANADMSSAEMLTVIEKIEKNLL